MVPAQSFALRPAALVAPQLNPPSRHIAPNVYTHRPVHLPAAGYRRNRLAVDAGLAEHLPSSLAKVIPPCLGPLLCPARLRTVDLVLDLRNTAYRAARAHNRRPNTLRTDIQCNNVLIHLCFPKAWLNWNRLWRCRFSGFLHFASLRSE